MRMPALLAWSWTVVILVICWLPRMYVPTHEAGPLVARWHFDKVVHAGMFTVFAYLWMRALAGRPRPLRTVVAAGLALAVVSELGQENRYVWRDASVLDGMADLAGVALGVVGFWAIRRGPDGEAAPPPDLA